MSVVRIDEVTTKPDITGSHGRAWTIDLDAGFKKHNMDPKDGLEVFAWMVEARFAHSLWHSYLITLNHMRQSNLHIYLPGATHEMHIQALDSEHLRQKSLDEFSFKPLRPSNFAAQFVAENDAEAVKRVEQSVRDICDAKISPDSDYINIWASIYGDNMVKK